VKTPGRDVVAGGRPPPLHENVVAREQASERVPRATQRAAQRRGWVTTRDRLHGRVVMRPAVVEMARTVGCNTVADGRAADPDRDRQRACPRSPRSCASAQILCDTGVENANDYFRSRARVRPVRPVDRPGTSPVDFRCRRPGRFRGTASRERPYDLDGMCLRTTGVGGDMGGGGVAMSTMGYRMGACGAPRSDGGKPPARVARWRRLGGDRPAHRASTPNWSAMR